MSIIAGIDYGYCSPAICVWDTETEFKFDNLHLFNINTKKKLAGKYGHNITISLFPEYTTEEERYRNVSLWASNILISMKVDEVCMEGYSYGSSAGLVFNIAENGSIIKQFMDVNKIPFTVPSPSEVKKSFTGKGNAKKDAMVDRFDALFSVDIHSIFDLKRAVRPKVVKPIDDICDAVAIMMTHSYFNKGT